MSAIKFAGIRQVCPFPRFSTLIAVASFRRSVSWGAARKMAHEKIGEKRGAGRLLAPSLSLLYFAPPFFRAAPQPTERLEEAIIAANSQQSKPIRLGDFITTFQNGGQNALDGTWEQNWSGKSPRSA